MLKSRMLHYEIMLANFEYKYSKIGKKEDIKFNRKSIVNLNNFIELAM